MQERLACRDIQMQVHFVGVICGEYRIHEFDVPPQILVPRFGQRGRIIGIIRLLHRRDRLNQPQKFTRLLHLDLVDAGNAVELDELAVNLVCCGIRFARHDPRDNSFDADSAEILRHADALIALDDIKALHVFLHDDRLIDADLSDRIAKRRPFAAKFCIQIQQRHKFRGECVGTLVLHRAFDQRKWDLHLSHWQLTFDLCPGLPQDPFQ